MAEIEQTISAIPKLKHRETVVTIQDQDEFVQKYEATNDHLADSTVIELNIFATQTNEVKDEVNTSRDETVTAKDLAKNYANADEDVEVETGFYSAKNFSIKAENARDLAEQYKIEAENAAATIASGTINDSVISLVNTWSSDKINSELNTKQDTLISGTNIKTIGGQSILGNGDVDIEATKALITKTFTLDEEYVLPLYSAVEGAIVGVQKEELRNNLTNNDWISDSSQFEQSGSSLNITNNEIALYSQPNTNFDISLGTYDSVVIPITETANARKFQLNQAEDKIYMLDSADYKIKQSAFDGSSNLTFADSDALSSIAGTNIPSMFINPLGTKAYVLSLTDRKVYQFNIAVAEDITTLSLAGYKEFDISGQDTIPEGLTFNHDMSKMYISGRSSDSVHQYTLSTPDDLDTVTYDNVSLYVGAKEINPYDISFESSGLKLFVIGNTSVSVNQYDLSTPYDISTAVDNNKTLSTSPESSPYALFFYNKGTKLYIYGEFQDSLAVFSTNSSFEQFQDNTYLTAVSSSPISTEWWVDINSMNVTETLNSQSIYYSFSNDSKTTFKIMKTGLGERTIARNNGGTWEYNSNTDYALETWTVASVNNEFTAIQEATALTINQLTSTDLLALSDAEQFILGDTLDMSVTLFTNSTTATPIFETMTFNYDSLSEWVKATEGVDYEASQYNTMYNEVKIKALSANNLKIRVI